MSQEYKNSNFLVENGLKLNPVRTQESFNERRIGDSPRAEYFRYKDSVHNSQSFTDIYYEMSDAAKLELIPKLQKLVDQTEILNNNPDSEEEAVKAKLFYHEAIEFMESYGYKQL